MNGMGNRWMLASKVEQVKGRIWNTLTAGLQAAGSPATVEGEPSPHPTLDALPMPPLAGPRPALVAALLALLAPPPLAGQSGGAVVAVVGATLWDGTGADPLPGATVIVQGGHISCAGTPFQCPLPPETTVIRADGRFLIPGLIDTHVHLLFQVDGVADSSLGPDLRELLARGITTVRDMGNHPARLLEAVAAQPPGPRVLPMQLIAGVRFFSSERERGPNGNNRLHAPAALGMRQLGWYPLMLTTARDAVTLVRQARAGGAIGIKLYQDLDPAQIVAVVQAAHAQGMPVWGHAWVQPASVLEQARANQDGVVHAAGLVGELLDRTARDSLRTSSALLQITADSATAAAATSPLVLAALDTLAAHGTFLEPTLHATQLGVARANRRNRRIPTLPERYSRAASAFGIEVTRRAAARGVPLTAGTDHTAYGPMAERAQLSEELGLLVDSIGLAPGRALLAATRDAARAIGPAAADAGVIATGKRADLVLLTADPLSDIRNVTRVEWVMRAGVLYRPEALRAP